MGKNNLEQQIADYVIQYKENHYRLAYSYVKNADDALDIVQESIYKALSSMDSLKNPSHIKSWFYRIVVNTSLDFLRKQKRIGVVDDETLSVLEGGAVDHYENLDLQKALDALPVNYRSVVILRYFEDLKLEEIADILNENVNTVKTRLYKSLKKLRVQMNDEVQEELA
ncbi:RNA polymerase sigma factor [Desulforamulus aeronauticus]|uniref:RNA polymerase, sigma subunit, SigV n=1 Tax=Desulforamulus aeronauticus DSM 10349 TaxID=1121421 RepID=A0A1M6QAD9_9FIRM|nr:sigma-70 family RNA polymerase sigma factor [Desulforamulus aeronauticus]SHK17126.1 RNA polymerase, sigma subunit, SigV [Desulforamulus aeronauticus DSM 10349]